MEVMDKGRNARELIERAVELRLISDLDAMDLKNDPCRMETVGIMATPEEVGQYVFRLTRETPAQLETRMREEDAKYYQLILARTANQDKQRANTTGGKRRRRRTRKARKYF